MIMPRKVTLVFVGFCLTFSVSPRLRAQNQSNNSGKESAGALTQRVEDLENQIESLRTEIAKLKKQETGSAATTAASSVPAPVPTQASLTGPTSVPEAKAPGVITIPPAPLAAQTPEGAPAQGEAAPAAGGAAAPAAPTLASLMGPLSVTGFVDGYYSYNFNHPHNSTTCSSGTSFVGASPSCSGLRAFDSPTNQLSLNMVELILAKPPDATNNRLGYNVTFGFGNAMNVVNNTEAGGLGFAQYLKEAFLSYLVPVGKGLQVDFGKFVTPAGAEVIETKDNWNYSRSLLFFYAIPFYHFGFRAKYTFSDKANVTGYVVNGWNNIIDNNTGKTYGASLALNPNKKWGVVETYFAGPETTNNNNDWRQLTDTVVTFNPTGKLSLMANYDYGRGDREAGLSRPVWWSGAAGYVRYAFNDKYAVAARYENYDDHDGFTTGTGAGKGQIINEGTFTFERTIASHLITRWEYRRDMSNWATLVKGTSPIKHQDTVSGGLVYVFDLREGK